MIFSRVYEPSQGSEELDHPVALGHPVPRRREREEDDDDDVRGPVSVRSDRVQHVVARRKLVEVAVDRDEDVVADSRAVGEALPARCVRAERLLNLVDGRRHRRPEEQDDHRADTEEERHDRRRARKAVTLEPFDSRPDRRGERQREQEQDHDVPDLPETEGDRADRHRGGRRLGRQADDVPVRSRLRRRGRSLVRLGDGVDRHAGIVRRARSARHRRPRRPAAETAQARRSARSRRRRGSPVISRAPRPCVTKLVVQRMKTSSRFWKPIR